jgi:hypothetical protein
MMRSVYASHGTRCIDVFKGHKALILLQDRCCEQADLRVAHIGSRTLAGVLCQLIVYTRQPVRKDHTP